MIKFGLPALDEAFQDVDTATILAEGTPGCGKAVLGYHLINKGLEDGNVCIVVTSSRSVEDMKKDLNYYKMRTEPIIWVQTVGESSDPKVLTASIGALYTISSALKEQLKQHEGKRIVVFIDALSYALMSNSVAEVYNFFNTMIRDLEKGNVVAFVTIETQMHEKKDLAAMEYLSHSVLEFVVENKEGKITHGFLVKKKGGRPAPDNIFAFKLTPKGLTLSGDATAEDVEEVKAKQKPDKKMDLKSILSKLQNV